MARKPELAKRIGAVMDAVGETGLLSMPRQIADVDGITGAGAEHVAKLTLAARSHDWVFSHVVNALQTLEMLSAEDWKRPFMVAVALRESFGKPVFNWDTAPVRRYASFQDFYHRELEQTFGRWSDLQALWQRRIDGEVSDDQAKQEIEARAAKAQAASDQEKANRRAEGRPKKTQDNAKTVIRSLSYGTSTAAALRRIDKAGLSDLHARVLSGALSANAAMIEAGFRKPAKRRVRTGLTGLRRAWMRATPDERTAFLTEIQL